MLIIRSLAFFMALILFFDTIYGTSVRDTDDLDRFSLDFKKGT